MPEPRPAGRPLRKGARILLVEDDPIARHVVQRLLEALGHVVDAVTDGQAGVNAWSARPYDAVLMDCQMPVLDGYEADAAHPGAGDGSSPHADPRDDGERDGERQRSVPLGGDGRLRGEVIPLK